MPAAGPVSGGTSIRIDGARLDGGDKALFHELWVSQVEDVRKRAEITCRFDAADGSAALGTVPATWQAEAERILCRTPSALNAINFAEAGSGSGEVSDPSAPFQALIGFSLNGQDSATSRIAYEYLPEPTLDHLTRIWSQPWRHGCNHRGHWASPRYGRILRI